MSNNLQDIRDKYQHDVTYIKDYVQYLETHFLVSIRMIGNIEEASPTFSASPQMPNLCSNNSIIQAEMDRYLHRKTEEMRELNIKEKEPTEPCGEDMTPEGDIICYLASEIHKGEYDPEKLFNDAQAQIGAMCIIKGDLEGYEDYLFLNDNPRRIRKLVEIALEEEKRRKHKSLSAEHTYIRMTTKSLELFDCENQINLYKQNFIQVMAYFDSCIFDMIRFCMEQRFFDWLSFFDNVPIKTHEIAACKSFEGFKAVQIESLLKKCYVKDLLNILHSKFEGVFIINGSDVYPILREMIERRNVHIHHNGIADQKYLTTFNIYGASSGDYLAISRDYFAKAVEITEQVVKSIATSCS